MKVCDVTYMIGEKVLLKISPMKGVMRFGKKGKLSPRYIGPFEILKKIGEVAYEPAFPLVYQVFIQCSMYPCSESMSGIRLIF